MAEPEQNLLVKTSALTREASAWVSGNIVDILIAGGIGIVVALVLVGIRSLGCRFVARLKGEEWPAIFARAVAKTNLFFIVMCSAALVAEHAETPPSLLRVINILFVVAAAIQAAVWVRELVLGYVQRRVGIDDEHSTLASAVSIIRLLVTVALFAIAIILILSNLGVNVTGLLAGLGIGGIAIGLAAQGIFSDLFAALSIIFDKPFRRGDTISFGNPPNQMTGAVQRIGLKSTRVRSLNGEEVVISNANLLNTQVQNWARLERRRALMNFGVPYHVPPETLAQLPHEIRAIVERQPLATFERAHLFRFGSSSIDLELVFQVDAPEMATFMEVRQTVMLDLIRRFAEMDVEFAYPAQVSFTAAPDGRLVMPYPPEPERDA
ncbi:MAG TPA: mechanosensitive ion channel domain-containing protein [Allosphingosinicella sp.]|jgi:small-conductance mechanosensitive channel